MPPAEQPPTYAELSDARLVEFIRAGAPSPHPAAQELRRRHLPRVLDYARLCCRDEWSADRLAARAFTLALAQIFQTDEPAAPWRHRMLTLVHEAAAGWITNRSRERLDAAYAAHLEEGHGGEPSGLPLVRGFAALPPATRTLLWHTLVEGEPDSEVARCTGRRAADVPRLAARARETYRDQCLRVYLERDADEECWAFGRILEVAAGREDTGRGSDLPGHLTDCPGCAAVLSGLGELARRPRPLVAAALLGWAGERYLPDVPAPAATALVPVAAGAAEPGRSPVQVRRVFQRPFTRAAPLVVCSGVVVAAVITGISATAQTGGDSERGRPGSAAGATRLPGPSATSPSATGSPGPSRTPSASPSSEAPEEPPSPTPTGPYMTVINAATGQCLDVQGAFFNGADVITGDCRSGADTQKWRLDPDGLVRNRANPGYCLDTRGRISKGVAISNCERTLDLLFFFDDRGRLRPQLASDRAVVPDDKAAGFLSFAPLTTDTSQRWRTG